MQVCAIPVYLGGEPPTQLCLKKSDEFINCVDCADFYSARKFKPEASSIKNLRLAGVLIHHEKLMV